MIRKAITTSLLVLLVTLCSNAQKLKKADKAVIASLEEHIHFLADDKLQGRRAGSEGEKLAMDYIAAQFAKAGLQPIGDNNTWFQAFDINDGKEISKSSYLQINGAEIKTTDYFPFIGSPDKAIESMPAIALREKGVPWFLNLKEELENNKSNPHFDVKAYIIEQAGNAAKKGATALIVYNNGTTDDALRFEAKEKSEPLPLPVVYISKPMAKKYFNDESASVEIKLRAAFSDKKRIGHNVLGYIDKGAATTVILGAHFDHLGYGEDNNSMYRGQEKLIHNGADDNASGTAALIEEAKLLKASKLKNNNYLFIAFSGEELGLFGSKYFVEHPTIDLSRVNYMINMDMVGRLNDSSKMVTIGGYGTSPLWGQLISSIKSNQYFATRFDSSGTGPSDHTSFYQKQIPVLFFFTGLHNDYHRPSDDADKINYVGEYRIVRYIYEIAEKANTKGKLAFSKTRESQTSTNTRFSVSMGIMPDYTYSGNGVRVDGTSEGRPAQKAGIKTGDIVIQLGDFPVVSMESYMQALNKFKKGDKTTVKVKRGNETIEASIDF
jgi:aminopeptidase YwaD